MAWSDDLPTIMLHGFLGSARSWDHAPVAPNLRITPDLFGHGVLPPVRSATTFDTECERLLELAPAGCQLLGYSMGARVALGMLCTAPEHFSSVTLVSVNPGLRTVEERQARLQLEESWCAHIDEFGLESFVDDWERLALFDSQACMDELAFERQRAIRTSHFAEGVVGAIRGLGLGVMPDLWPRLPALRVPMTIVCGESDRKFLEICRQAQRVIPGSRLEIVKDCGHNPVVEKPELFWAKL